MKNMAQMEPMKTNRKVLQLLCMYPLEPKQNNKATSDGQRTLCVAFTAMTIITLSILGAGSAAFIARFVKTDLESALYALFPTSAVIGIMYMLFIGIMSKGKIAAMFENLSGIYTLCKYYFLFIFNAVNNDYTDEKFIQI